MTKRLLTGLSIAALLVLCGYTVIQAAPKVNVAQQETDWKDLAAEKAHQDLSSRNWTIYIWPSESKGTTSRETDMLTFANGKVTSRNFSNQGYPESNYGLFVGDDGSINWETMQAREGKEIDLAFLRGQLFSDGTMRGSITMQPQKGAKRIYSYSTQMPGTEATATAVTTPAKRDRR